MATKVNLGTKRADEMIHDFNRTHYKGTSLYDVYGRVSKDKRDSWEKIVQECRDLEGWDLHITGASSYSYSCMYAFYNEVGNIVLRKKTVGNTFDLEIAKEKYDELVV